MTDGHCFISYSHKDADDFGYQLANDLEAGNPFIDTWFDKRDILPGETWDEKVPEAIKTCKCFLFAATEKSIDGDSVCADEWDLALRYKKPILILRLQKDIEIPFRLRKRQWIDLSSNLKAGMAKLRQAIQRLDSPDGQIQILKDRLADANRDLPDAKTDEEKSRILDEIYSLGAEIKANESFLRDPDKAKKLTRKNINAGLERDRQPINPISGKISSKFINPRPGSIPDYFEGRLFETQEIADFLRNNFQRIMTINGRAGSGKTVLACRVLQHLESGQFPNELGEFKIGGIVYLSEISNYKVNVANLFSGLLQLIESRKAKKVEELYKEAKVPVDEKLRALLLALPNEPVILLMDNFEDLLSPDEEAIVDQELYIALKTILQAELHNLKVLITTRMLPRQLNMIEPSRQYIKHLEEGLPSPFAENVLRKLDKDGHAGLRDATEELLGRVREATLGYPRALESLYGILRVDRYSNVEELLIEGLPDTVVEKFVGEAFNRLDPTRQKIMQTLAVFNRPVSSAAVDFALQFHISGVNSAPILERLVSMHFVRREAKRYFLHPADREYALSRMPQGNSGKKIGQGARARTWDQHSLTLRAADYYVEVRKPRTEWKKMDDLAAQLAEFDLRCAAGDYDIATSVLTDIDFDYLLLWGHYRLMIDLHEKLQGKINDKTLARISAGNLGTATAQIGQVHVAIKHYEKVLELARQGKNKQHESASLNNLGNCYNDLGDIHKAIELYEQALVIIRDSRERRGEGNALGNLGSCYNDLGDIHKAIELYEQALIIDRKDRYRSGERARLGNLGSCYAGLGDIHKAIELHEQALVINREVGDRGGESNGLENIGQDLLELGELPRAEEKFIQAIQIADEISLFGVQQTARLRLVQIYLSRNDLPISRVTVEIALQYNVPKNNHTANALHGIIALRQGERETAQEAFTKSIAQADEILAKTPDYYEALDAKGLALCGLALCADDGQLTIDNRIAEAVETFKRAREIAPHAGVVKSVLRLFDELVKCDEEGILAEVRNAAVGTETQT